MAIVFKTQTPFTDSNLPRLKIDQILPDGNGALFLLDASLNSDNSFISNPTGTIKNHVWDRAQVLIPSGNETNLQASTSKTFGTNGGIVELTGKKGIHTIVSQVNGAVDHGFIINLPDLIKQYFISNPTNKFFVSIWGRTTRVTLDTANQFSTHGITKSNINNGRFALALPESLSPTYPTLGKRLVGSDKSTGDYLRNYGQDAWANGATPIPTSISEFVAYFQYGSRDPYKSFNINKSASGIFYKIYIEDLTVSGRTYADVDAIDFGLYTAAFSAGGRFFGDTFTNPATIA